MTRTIALSLVSAATAFASLSITGCVGSGPDQSMPPEPPAAAIGHEHLMLTHQARALLDSTLATTGPGREAQTGKEQPMYGSAKTLHYYGGPVVKNVHVVPVYWNSGFAYQSQMNQFYSAIVTGAEMSFLSQYSTSSPAQTIGSGSRGTPYVDNQTSTNLTDAQIQSELTRLFNTGALSKPNGNSYYPVHFPAGVHITDSSGNQSCVQFCAYHGTYTYNGQDVFYGVLPDVGQSGCAGGCGTSISVVSNSTSVASHEFAETVTDPAVGLATVYGPPLGWYNATYGEIGDICNDELTTATLGDGRTYTVQKLWSNKTSTCTTP